MSTPDDGNVSSINDRLPAPYPGYKNRAEYEAVSEALRQPVSTPDLDPAAAASALASANIRLTAEVDRLAAENAALREQLDDAFGQRDYQRDERDRVIDTIAALREQVQRVIDLANTESLDDVDHQFAEGFFTAINQLRQALGLDGEADQPPHTPG